MQLSDSPVRAVRHEPSCCAGCAAGLCGAPDEGEIRRQATEVPEARAEVTEHRVIGRRCRGEATCGLQRNNSGFLAQIGHPTNV